MVTLDQLYQEFDLVYSVRGEYRIDMDRNVWVEGDLKAKKHRSKLLFNFQQVTGDVDLSFSKLKSLKGLPAHVGGRLNISNNLLTSLEGCSQTVGRDFWVMGMDSEAKGNKSLKSLAQGPRHVAGTYWIDYDEHLGLLPVLVASKVFINRSSSERYSTLLKRIQASKIIEKYCGTNNPGDVLRCASELTEHGLEGNAEW